jgi:hypothetical protein
MKKGVTCTAIVATAEGKFLSSPKAQSTSRISLLLPKLHWNDHLVSE